MNANVYQHFRKDEHPFIDLVSEWLEQVASQYAPVLTDFLDPRQMFIVETLIRRNSELQYAFYGGYETAERKRGIIYPEYFAPVTEDYEVTLIEILYPTKFGELSHGKILGTLLNLGIKRDFFGDIISDGERWQFFVKKEMASFVMLQVTKIGKLSVRLEEKKYVDVILPKDEWAVEKTTISSLRIDAVISSVYNISRQRAKQLVDSNKVKINWVETNRSDFVLDYLDIVSIRGFGRIQLREIEGKTRKDRVRVEIGVLRK